MSAVIPPVPEQPKRWRWWQKLIGILRRLPGIPDWARVGGQAGADAGLWPNKSGKP